MAIMNTPIGARVRFPEPEQLRLQYDGRLDTLLVNLDPPRLAVSVDLDGAWVRLATEDSIQVNVVGWEIEGFERHFLPKHPDLAAEWQKRQPRRSRWSLPFHRKDPPSEPFIAAVLRWLRQEWTRAWDEQQRATQRS